MDGLVEAIHIAPTKGAPVEARQRIGVGAGVGLDGDRNHRPRGAETGRHGGGDVTLIEAEALEDASAQIGIPLQPGETRRNVTTRNVRLNELVGRRFWLGPVLCEGAELAEPCQYLVNLIGKPVLRPLVHRGGLRAEILSDGVLAVGDAIRMAGATDAG
ncbi:MAG: hypothetical protein H0X16_10515 [Chloroflexi bacterium]|nr:hypothetical protein [Chloroflexota bacterium]